MELRGAAGLGRRRRTPSDRPASPVLYLFQPQRCRRPLPKFFGTHFQDFLSCSQRTECGRPTMDDRGNGSPSRLTDEFLSKACRFISNVPGCW